ncbi:hypothetical protein LX32DRAFT_371999 [Colletotrichum zoysiae]|uniref:Uncharacterized protein n=1 Tax=Colletotrichum zoysiae TaxID=1216348 RepID=A0AAD9HUM4_9PEZI|nr:hypothetical protein LX32DRAFT_371999 [Colletotrichum zoysiae]
MDSLGGSKQAGFRGRVRLASIQPPLRPLFLSTNTSSGPSPGKWCGASSAYSSTPKRFANPFGRRDLSSLLLNLSPSPNFMAARTSARLLPQLFSPIAQSRSFPLLFHPRIRQGFDAVVPRHDGAVPSRFG